MRWNELALTGIHFCRWRHHGNGIVMHRLINNESRIADVTAVGVNVIAGWTWMAEVNELLQLVLSVAGIVAAIAAARYHIIRANKLKDDRQRKD